MLRERLGKRRYWIAAPHHINYFSFDSLTRLLQRLGFAVVERDTTFPMEFFVLMGDDYIGNDAVGRGCHKKRMTFETNLMESGLASFKRDLYRFLASKGVGREVVLYAQKPVAQ